MNTVGGVYGHLSGKATNLVGSCKCYLSWNSPTRMSVRIR